MPKGKAKFVPSSDPEQLLRVHHIVPFILPVSRYQFYNLIDEGVIPPPIKLSKGCAVWKRKWITDAVEKLEAER